MSKRIREERRQKALTNVLFALQHSKVVLHRDGTDLGILERGENIGERNELADYNESQPYLDVTIDDHPYRIVLEDHGD